MGGGLLRDGRRTGREVGHLRGSGRSGQGIQRFFFIRFRSEVR